MVYKYLETEKPSFNKKKDGRSNEIYCLSLFFVLVQTLIGQDVDAVRFNTVSETRSWVQDSVI